MKIFDFRSDTVTRPTVDMKAAMAAAELGDDVFGEDPSVNQLEAKVAALLGKEAAMFVPSGTMANQIALNVHCRAGDSVLIEEDSHCFINELGGGAALTGVQFDQVPLIDDMSDAAIRQRVRGETILSAPTRLMVVENTHGRNGGEARPVSEIERICRVGREAKLQIHCDGARLWNAAAKFGVAEADYARHFDTLAVCFSKGLGAPVGSALVGPKTFIAQARRVRKRWGGGMRQAGILAAAAVYALDHHRVRLADDHAMAARLVDRFAALAAGGIALRMFPQRHPTNMVYVGLPPGTADRAVGAAREKGLLFHTVGGDVLRLVTHLDLPSDAPEAMIGFLKSWLPTALPS